MRPLIFEGNVVWAACIKKTYLVCNHKLGDGGVIEQEAHTLSQLDNPYIVKVISSDANEMITLDKGLPFCKLPHLLFHQKLIVLEQVLLALEYLWKQNLCHGDLNFSNIIIDKDGKTCLIDFETCKETNQENMNSDLIFIDDFLQKMLHGAALQNLNEKETEFFTTLTSVQRKLTQLLRDPNNYSSIIPYLLETLNNISHIFPKWER